MVSPPRGSAAASGGLSARLRTTSPGGHGALQGMGDDAIIMVASRGSGTHLVTQGQLGSGGQGKVLKAFDPNLGRVVAMKVLAPHLAKAPASLRRFVEEARVMAKLDHPNIIPVHDLVVEEGCRAHFVMKLVRGRTLDSLVRERLSSPGPSSSTITLRELLLTFLKVCDALAFAHARDIIHCDLKPDNIMVGEFGETYLMDWGIAWQMSGGDQPSPPPARARSSVRGTPDFMSPEQAGGDPAGPTKRTDVFGLGAVLYFILTGLPPFPGKTAAQALSRARKGTFEDPERAAGTKLPPALVRIVRRAMARDPRERFEGVLQLRQEVDQLLRGDWHLPLRTFPSGAAIVREGEWADAAYIIESGSCVVWKMVGGERRVLRTLGAGAVFGETAILSGDVRTATVESVGEVVVRVVTRELFQDQLGVDSWLAKFVLALADRFREVEQRVWSSNAAAAGDAAGPNGGGVVGGVAGGLAGVLAGAVEPPCTAHRIADGDHLPGK